jgi:hypothetical protein
MPASSDEGDAVTPFPAYEKTNVQPRGIVLKIMEAGR